MRSLRSPTLLHRQPSVRTSRCSWMQMETSRSTLLTLTVAQMITAELPRSLLMAETRPLTLIVLRLASTRSTLTVTDVSGNISTVMRSVTVTDTVAPTAICQNITVQLDANGDVSINAADIDVAQMITAELPRSLLMAETRPLTLIVLRLASTRSHLQLPM